MRPARTQSPRNAPMLCALPGLRRAHCVAKDIMEIQELRSWCNKGKDRSVVALKAHAASARHTHSAVCAVKVQHNQQVLQGNLVSFVKKYDTVLINLYFQYATDEGLH